jgi:hypothetical protein
MLASRAVVHQTLVSVSVREHREPAETDTKVSAIPSSDRSDVARLVSCAGGGYIMTPTATQRDVEQTTDKAAIRPFRVNVPEAELIELRRRINATSWPDRETVTDASQGVQLATVQALAQYWATEYNWRACEASEVIDVDRRRFLVPTAGSCVASARATFTW